MSVQNRIKFEKQWRERLCNECENFRHVPFTVGLCARNGECYAVSITTERAKPKPQGCGEDAYWFSPAVRKRRSA